MRFPLCCSPLVTLRILGLSTQAVTDEFYEDEAEKGDRTLVGSHSLKVLAEKQEQLTVGLPLFVLCTSIFVAAQLVRRQSRFLLGTCCRSCSGAPSPEAVLPPLLYVFWDLLDALRSWNGNHNKKLVKQLLEEACSHAKGDQFLYRKKGTIWFLVEEDSKPVIMQM